MKNPLHMTPRQLGAACREEERKSRALALRTITSVQLAAIEGQGLRVVPSWMVETLLKVLADAPDDQVEAPRASADTKAGGTP